MHLSPSLMRSSVIGVDQYLSASGYLGDNIRRFFCGQRTETPFQMVNSTGKYLRWTQKFYDVIFTRVSRVDLMRKSSSLILGLAVCSEVTADVARMDTKIEATSDIAHLRRSAMLFKRTFKRAEPRNPCPSSASQQLT
ncbi:dynamin-related protein 5A-like [Alnus glutinosa]|uniref:dynamin-related protein 5A-like n=1 Tax=Alnus glutinosa TaxID=3517 RepID=UPI002D792AB9|nr:dynamin-related protein 5A-like [Alnus glutinosa]XP_062157823.1 dynamin-related protein 5A-like [Alnus glutinosa]